MMRTSCKARHTGSILLALLMIRAIGRAEDCNNNGVEDASDIVNGTSDDCQPDGVPDECQLPIVLQFFADDGADLDFFGSSASLDGELAVVGAPGDNCASESKCGSAYAFRFDGTKWIQDAKLVADDSAAFDEFGTSVSLSGAIAVLGAPYADCAAGPNCGAAYVFRFDGVNWIQDAKLTADDADDGDKFGYSVSVHNGVAVVGSHGDDCADRTDCGSAYVFRLNGADWIQEAKLAAEDAAERGEFGSSVFLDGDRVAIGALFKGSAYVFRFDGAVWTQEAKLIADDAYSRSFGDSVSIHGETAVIGAPMQSCLSGTECGAAYMFRFDGTDWVQEAKLIGSDEEPYDRFGTSVSISGDLVAVGTTGYDCPKVPWCGSAYLFRFDGTDWTPSDILIPVDPSDFQQSGYTVSLDGSLALVGAPRAHGVGAYRGTAYMFRLDITPTAPSGDCNGNAVPDECDTAIADCNDNDIPDDCFGTGFEVDCNVNLIPDECDLINGAPDENGNGVPDECDAAPGLGDGVPKNRFITITPTPSGALRSIHVTVVDMPLDPAREGDVWWAGPEASLPNGPFAPLRGARLECTSTPYSQVWTDGFLQLFGGAVIPLSTYAVRMCLPDGIDCSAPLIVETGKWGDIAPLYYPQNPIEPGFGDISGAVDAFKGYLFAPDISQADLLSSGGEAVDFVANFADITAVVDAFKARAYPFGVPACP